ncbi:AAA family ATPase [Hyphococcus sp.]|uniref:AAA family ATPase n=1 Tax=Hyphococcus sp. TaxID=2038636 RepID=UPI003D14F748
MDNQLLFDLEDYVALVEPDFNFVGEGDIEKISSILGQNQYSNLIYVGRSGVGKTANLYGIIQKKKKTIEGRIRPDEKRLPLHMIDRRFLLLDTNTLFDSNDPQKIEQSIKRVFAELDKPGDHVLVVEDGNDLLKGIEDNQCQGLISILVRELKKRSFNCILMVRDEPGQNKLGAIMNAHSDITELFSVLEKKPSGRDEVMTILEESKAAIERHYDNLTISDDANREIVNLTMQYPNLSIYMRQQPARALRVRDRIASQFVSRRQARPPELDALESELAALNAKGEGADAEKRAEVEKKIEAVRRVWEERAQALGAAYLEKRKHERGLEELRLELVKEEDKLRENFKETNGREPTERDIAAHKTLEIKEIEKYLRETARLLEEADKKARAVRSQNNEALTLSVADVRDLFSEMSGIPTKDLNADEATRALGLEERLKQKIFGQDDAVATIADSVLTAKAGLNNPEAPIGSFIAVGSSGVGKTYSAECLAEDLFDDADALTVFDMSEFMEKHTVARLIGAPPGYAGYGEGGMLTNAVRRRPYQVILLDEVEKAHPDVFKILLQLLDKGRLSDELGTVDFKNTLFIMTTNLGQHLSFDAARTSENSSEEIKAEIRRIFPQELINRVDNFLLFKALKPSDIERIIKRLIAKKNDNLQRQKKAIAIDLPDADIAEIVAKKYLPEEGARQVQKFVQNNLINQAAKIVLAHSGESAGGVIKARFDPEKEDFSWDFEASAPDTTFGAKAAE